MDYEMVSDEYDCDDGNWIKRRNRPCHGNKSMILYHISDKKTVDGIAPS